MFIYSDLTKSIVLKIFLVFNAFIRTKKQFFTFPLFINTL